MDEMKILDALQEKHLFLSQGVTCRTMMKLFRLDREELDGLFLEKYGTSAERTLERLRLSYARELVLEYGMSFDSAVILSVFSSKRKAKKALAALDY